LQDCTEVFNVIQRVLNALKKKNQSTLKSNVIISKFTMINIFSSFLFSVFHQHFFPF